MDADFENLDATGTGAAAGAYADDCVRVDGGRPVFLFSVGSFCTGCFVRDYRTVLSPVINVLPGYRCYDQFLAV